jgi:aminopeptidase N
VDSRDFQRALEDSSGQNLDAFFEDWIRDGAGFPHLAVSSHWSPDRKQLDLSIDQLQADLPFENAFDLWLDIEIVTDSGSTMHRVHLTQWSNRIQLPADSEPLMVNLDKGNWMVAYIHQERGLDETLRALNQDDLSVALRAARQLSEDFAGAPRAVFALATILGNTEKHWGLRQEVALDLGNMGTYGAVLALVTGMSDADARIRRAAALGLGRAGGDRAISALKDALAIDPDEEVAGAAAWSLGVLQVPGVERLLVEQLERPSAYYDYRRISALAGLAELEDPALAPIFMRYITPQYLRETRLGALEAWKRSSPADPALAKALRELTRDDDAEVRGAALEMLGSLHLAVDKAYLLDYAEREADKDLAERARKAAEEIAGFSH